jgi:hypothetical protein
MMREFVVLLANLLARLAILLGSRGSRAVLVENRILKHQLLALHRSRPWAPKLRTADRVLLGFFGRFLHRRRLLRAAVILKPATLLRFHRGLRDLKYRFLYSSRPKRKRGPTGPTPELIQAICELKRLNPRFGCPKIAQQLAKALGLEMDKDVVRRVLALHYRPERGQSRPSWLTFLGHSKNSLWNLDLFRTESILLRNHWLLVVMDQLARRIIGFGVQAAAVDGPALCRMFNQGSSGQRLPLSGDMPAEKANDPAPQAVGLENYRWQSHCHGLFELPIAA